MQEAALSTHRAAKGVVSEWKSGNFLEIFLER